MKRPLIESGPVSQFGEADPNYILDHRATEFTEDLQYVPGFSDLLRKRDMELVEYGEGTRKGSDVQTLPANVYWARRASVGGVVDSRKLMSIRNAHYRPAKKEDVGKPWLTQLGVGWQVLPDGSIINPAGDGQLMVLEGQAAANRFASKERKWLDQSGNIELAPSQEGKAPGREILGKDGQSVVDSPSKVIPNRAE